MPATHSPGAVDAAVAPAAAAASMCAEGLQPYAWQNEPGYVYAPEQSTGGAAGEEAGTLRVGADTSEVRLVLKREAHVLGRLVTPEGAPVTRFRVNGLPVEDVNGAKHEYAPSSFRGTPKA